MIYPIYKLLYNKACFFIIKSPMLYSYLLKEETHTMNLKERADKLKEDIPTLFLALKDSETPLLAKILACIVIVYALSPIDLIPDFIPVIGYLDDIILLPILVALTIKLIPSSVLERNRKLSKSLWVNGKPKKWYYAIPFLVIWILFIHWIMNIILN